MTHATTHGAARCGAAHRGFFKEHHMAKRQKFTAEQQLKILELALESAVEISIAVGNEGSRAYEAADTQGGNAASDVVRENIIAAATTLSELEVRDEDLWSRHDWRDTCDAIADVITTGGRVVVADLLR